MENENSDKIVLTNDTGIVFSEEEIAKQIEKIKQMIEYKNKTAKELFEELGYELKEETIKLSDGYTETMYHYNMYTKDDYIKQGISFVEPRRKIYPSVGEWTVEEIKAINKQIEELGW